MKNSLQGFSSRFEDSEGRISKLEDTIKGTQTGEEKKERSEQSLQGPLGLLSGPTYALWESQKEEKERERERSIENICRVIATKLSKFD